MLIVRNLTKIFAGQRRLFSPPSQDFIAVNNISFTIDAGQVVGILGPNGAGKTTTINMLLDILTPTSGSISYFGKDLRHYRSQILQHIGYASTYTKLPNRLSVQENLEIYGRLYSIALPELRKRIKKYLGLFGMEDRAHQLMGSLSAGQTTRVMLTKAFMVQPKIILLDEPTAALDPDIAQDVRTFILEQQREHNITVLLASHNMDEVTAICDRVIVMSNGTIIADDTPDTLAQSTSNARITLAVLDGMKRIAHHAQQEGLVHTVHDRTIEIMLDEHKIAQFLAHLAQLNVSYTHIAINKPTLEDYFLNIARSSAQHRRKE